MSHRLIWGVVIAAVLLAVAVGVASYDAGMARGLASAGATAAQGTGAAGPPYAYYGWHGHRPFPFFFLGPLFGFFFLLVVLRMLFGGVHRRRFYGPPWYGPGDPWDEWHRRAHERMKEPAADADRPGR